MNRIVIFIVLGILFGQLVSVSYGESQTISAEDNILDVKLSYEPKPETTVNIDFINPQTQKIQNHIDYTVTLYQNNKTILSTPLTHTSEGSVKIPVSFPDNGRYTAEIQVKGILFEPVTMKLFSFDVVIDDSMVQTEKPVSEKTLDNTDPEPETVITDGMYMTKEEALAYEKKKSQETKLDQITEKFNLESIRLLQQTIPESEEELWEFVGEEKSKKYNDTLDKIKSKGISFDTISGIQMSRLSEYEKTVLKDMLEEMVEFMKFKSGEFLYKMDSLENQLRDEVKVSDISKQEKDDTLNDFEFYVDAKRNEFLNTMVREIMVVQSSLSIKESPQRVADDIESYYNQIKQGKSPTKPAPGGGCLIATATYGTELAPQVQILREIRDSTLLSTQSGTAFLAGFNQIYYSFSPTVADWERQNPIFKETVKVFLTPMIHSVQIINIAEHDSEEHVLGLGVAVILLNVGIYIVIPVYIVLKLYNYTRKVLNVKL